jgi:hypothetical protein
MALAYTISPSRHLTLALINRRRINPFTQLLRFFVQGDCRLDFGEGQATGSLGNRRWPD